MRHVLSWSWRCALVLALGALGLALVVASFTRWGARRVERSAGCLVCRRHRRWQGTVVVAVAAVVLVGSGLRLHQDSVTVDPPACGMGWFLEDALPELSQAPEVAPAWARTRTVMTAPATGLAHGYASLRGREFCTVGHMTVAFIPSQPAAGGTTVGDLFLTRVEPGLSGSRADALGRHESRHVDQWTAATLLAGPLALPVLYAVDETLFPGSRNHFERGAGLEDGGYPPPSGTGPDPQGSGGAVLLALALLLGRHRLRYLVGQLQGTHAGRPPTPGRCLLHTSPGWRWTRSTTAPPRGPAERRRARRTPRRRHRRPRRTRRGARG